MKDLRTRLLRELVGGSRRVEELALRLGISRSHAYRLVGELRRAGVVEVSGGVARFAGGRLAFLFRRVVDRYVVDPLFDQRFVQLLYYAREPRTAGQLLRLTGLPEPTLYRLLSKAAALGFLRKDGRKYALVDDGDLRELVEELVLRQALGAAGEGVPVYVGPGFVIKRVPRGAKAGGSPTAFSLFERYGLPLSSPWDYYVEPPVEPSAEVALVHALLAAQTRYERSLAAAFYLKNRGRIDMARARRLARGTPALRVLAELDSYVLGMPTSISGQMLPWSEFRQLAESLGLRVEPAVHARELEAYFEGVGERLERSVVAYVFGGLNLVMLGVKVATKDVDIIVKDVGDFEALTRALEEAGYKPPRGIRVGRREAGDRPSAVYAKGPLRVDVFTSAVAGLELTPGMARRAEKGVAYGKLTLKFLAPEDVVLLKAAAGRERDVEDIALLARKHGINWDKLLKSLQEQKPDNAGKAALALLETLDLLEEAYGITAPRKTKLKIENIALKYAVKKALEIGYTKPSEIRKLIDFPESRIRRILKELKTKHQTKE